MATFGSTATTDGDNCNMDTDRIRGTLGTPAAGNGVADSITARLKASSAVTRNCKCALYNHATSAWVGTTTEVSCSLTTSYQNFNFPFSVKPNVVNGTVYVIVVWMDYGSVSMQLGSVDNSSSGNDHYQDLAYAAFPDPATFSTYIMNPEIYCTYTPGGAYSPSTRSGLVNTMTTLLNSKILFS
jgi:hypothetical protein